MHKEQFILRRINHPIGDMDHKVFALLTLPLFIPDPEQKHNMLVMFSHPAVMKIVIMSLQKLNQLDVTTEVKSVRFMCVTDPLVFYVLNLSSCSFLKSYSSVLLCFFE